MALTERELRISQECVKHEMIGCQVCTPPDGSRRPHRSLPRRTFSDPVMQILELKGHMTLAELASYTQRTIPAVRITVRFLQDVYGALYYDTRDQTVDFVTKEAYAAGRRTLGTQWDWPGER